MIHSDALMTELTWQVLIDRYLTSLLLVHQLNFGLWMIYLKSIEHNYIRILKVSVLQAMPS